MIGFNDLKFVEMEDKFYNGIKCRVHFDNGYGASIVKHNYSYGGREGLYEIAVLGSDGTLHYDNPVAKGDVRGYLTEEDVDTLIKEIQQL